MALPRVLAGPIVRRVETGRLLVLGRPQRAGHRHRARLARRASRRRCPTATRRSPRASSPHAPIGTGLHVVVVTVDTSGTPLRAGERYSYDLQVRARRRRRRRTCTARSCSRTRTRRPGSPTSTAEAPLHRALGFEKDKLPSFLAPPSTFAPTEPPTPAAGLRLAHASCRRPGSGAVDALPGVVELVKNDATRPHQLHLTGDQIYADDIATPFLPLVAAVGAELAGCPVAARLPARPAHRRHRIDAGDRRRPSRHDRQPAGDAPQVAALAARRVHRQRHRRTTSITFPEFVAHYLLAWSPRVWRAVPTFAEAFATTPGARRGDRAVAEPAVVLQRRRSSRHQPRADPARLSGAARPTTTRARRLKGFNRSAHQIARYAASSPAVAQVLANTPTYMIFDDHEVADDWNLNGRWATRVYGREWGRFIVRNGLLAYTLMQALGQRPGALRHGRAGPQAARRHPGRRRPGHGAHAGRRPPTSTSCSASTRRRRPSPSGCASTSPSRRRTTASSCSTRAPIATSATSRSRHRTWSSTSTSNCRSVRAPTRTSC